MDSLNKTLIEPAEVSVEIQLWEPVGMCKREARPLFQGVPYSVEEESPDPTVKYFSVTLRSWRPGRKGQCSCKQKGSSFLGFIKYYNGEGAVTWGNQPWCFPATIPRACESSRWTWTAHHPPVSSRMDRGAPSQRLAIQPQGLVLPQGGGFAFSYQLGWSRSGGPSSPIAVGAAPVNRAKVAAAVAHP